MPGSPNTLPPILLPITTPAADVCAAPMASAPPGGADAGHGAISGYSAPSAADSRIAPPASNPSSVAGSIERAAARFAQNSPIAFETIEEGRIDPSLPIVAVFDFHGTLMEPTWKDEYKEAHRRLVGHIPSDSWIDDNILNKDEAHIAGVFQGLTDFGREEIIRTIRNTRRELRDKDTPRLKYGALELLSELKERGIPILVISGSRRRRILQQIENLGLCEFVPADHVMGRQNDERAPSQRDDIVESIRPQFANHNVIYFDDWTEGLEKMRNLGGICMGLPQGQGMEYETNRKALIVGGVNYILPRLPSWMEVQGILHIKNWVQPEGPRP